MRTSGKLAALVLLAVPAVCAAQATGVKYVGWSAGQSMTTFNSSGNNFGVANMIESYDKDESAAKFYAGYEFNRTWAVEGGYAMLGTPKVMYTGTGAFAGATGRANIKNTAWFLAGKGTLPLGNHFGLFAKLGITGNKSDFSASTGSIALNAQAGFPLAMTKVRVGPVAGVGLEFRLTDAFRLRAEYEDFGRFNTDMDAGRTSASMWSIGATYSF